MAIFLATEENQNFLKFMLMSDFAMKSAHASEAIAALAGFGSNAAFRAATNSVVGPLAVDADLDRFENRSTSLGYDFESQEYLRLAYSRLAWPHAPWKIVRKSDVAARDAWYFDCERRSAPFIVIEKARKYVTLCWDHVSFGSHYDRRIKGSHSEDLGRIMFRLYQLTCNGVEPKSFFDGSWAVGEIRGLSEPTARCLGNEFFKLLNPGNLPTAGAKAA